MAWIWQNFPPTGSDKETSPEERKTLTLPSQLILPDRNTLLNGDSSAPYTLKIKGFKRSFCHRRTIGSPKNL